MTTGARTRLLVVAPHRGDAALALGGSIGRWLAAGHAVEIISCFTRSDQAPFSDAGSLHPNDRMSFVSAVRRREDETWRRSYRNPRLSEVDLNLKDAPLRLHCAETEVWGLEAQAEDPALAKALGKIERALTLGSADAVLLPLALGGHVDHRTARAVAAAWVSRLAVGFYEDLPEAVALTEDEIAAEANQLASELRLELIAHTTCTPSDAAAERKRRLAVEFDSQLDDSAVAAIAERAGARGERVWSGPDWSHRAGSDEAATAG